MRYLMADGSHLIERGTWKFVKMSDKAMPYDIDVPYFFWDFPEPNEHVVVTGMRRLGKMIVTDNSYYRRVNHLALHDLEVQYSLGYKHAELAFKQQDRFNNISLDVFPHTITVRVQGEDKPQMAGIDVQCDILGKDQTLYCQLTKPPWPDLNFVYIDGLDRGSTYGTGEEQLSFGLSHSQYRVSYRGRSLSGMTYALVSGLWAVLLNDSLQYDSLAILNGAKTGILDVKVFLHTVNPYVVKLMTLAR